MDVSQLRIALISGNYNMVRDGPTQALGKLVDHLLAHGAAVRIFCPTVDNPQVDQPGEIVSIPSFAIPGRGEYRIPIGLVAEAKKPVRGIPAQYRPRRQPRPGGAASGEMGARSRRGGARQRSHPLRNLSAILPPRLHGTGRGGVAAQALSPLRRAGRPVGRPWSMCCANSACIAISASGRAGSIAPSSTRACAIPNCAAASALATMRSPSAFSAAS